MKHYLSWVLASLALLPAGCADDTRSCIDCGRCGLTGGPNPETLVFAFTGTEANAPVISFGLKLKDDCDAANLDGRLRWNDAGHVEFVATPPDEPIEPAHNGRGTDAAPWFWENGVTASAAKPDLVTYRIHWRAENVDETWTCHYDAVPGFLCIKD